MRVTRFRRDVERLERGVVQCGTTYETDGVRITDRGNGVDVDGKRYAYGDAIELGDVVIRVRPDEAVGWQRPAWAPPPSVHDTPYEPLPPGWEVEPGPRVWREQLSDDPVEHDLLAQLRVQPQDEGLRIAYSDWLEQRGREVAIDVITSDDLVPFNICRATQECPRMWSAFATATDDERRRYCDECGAAVWYCTTVQELRARRRHAVVIDRALVVPVLDLDAIVREVVDPRWMVRAAPDAWHLNPTFDHSYTIRLFDHVLELGYGGDARQTPPVAGRIATLPLVGLARADVVTWLRHALASCPPTRLR